MMIWCTHQYMPHCVFPLTTSWSGSAFRITGTLWGESICYRSRSQAQKGTVIRTFDVLLEARIIFLTHQLNRRPSHPYPRFSDRSRWIPHTKPVTRSFDVFFDLRLNKRLSKQPWGWWLETPSWSLWRQCYGSWMAESILENTGCI